MIFFSFLLDCCRGAQQEVQQRLHKGRTGAEDAIGVGEELLTPGRPGRLVTGRDGQGGESPGERRLQAKIVFDRVADLMRHDDSHGQVVELEPGNADDGDGQHEDGGPKIPDAALVVDLFGCKDGVRAPEQRARRHC